MYVYTYIHKIYNIYICSYNARTKWGRIDYFVRFIDVERGRRRKTTIFHQSLHVIHRFPEQYKLKRLCAFNTETSKMNYIVPTYLIYSTLNKIS